MSRKEELLSEKNYQKGVTLLQTAGIVIILCALSLIAFGITRFMSASSMDIPPMSAAGWFEASKKQSFTYFAGGACCMVGVFFTAVGGMVIAAAHRRKILAWQVQSVMPIGVEAAEKIQPVAAELGRKTMDTMAPAFGRAAEEISRGIHKGRTEAGSSPVKKYCKHCGEVIDGDSSFCSYCGKQL